MTQESETIRSFVLVPVDGALVLRHEPGQYLGFLFDLPGHGTLKRNYSISCAPNDRAYRITVKREAHPGVPAGIVSTWLHDHARFGTVLRATPPAGDFFLDRASEAPVVLVSGGVGLTPMLSMLAAIEAEALGRPTWYVHGAMNGCVHAMRGAAMAAAAGNPNIRVRTFYAAPEAEDRCGQDYDEAGRITAAWLVANTPHAEATYYVCGSKPFMASLIGGLRREGIPDARLRFEFFGPADELVEDEARLAA